MTQIGHQRVSASNRVDLIGIGKYSGLLPCARLACSGPKRPPLGVKGAAKNRCLGIGQGGVGGRSAQQVQPHFDRFIFRLIGRHVGLRAGLLGVIRWG
jgi:hypothetical protein